MITLNMTASEVRSNFDKDVYENDDFNRFFKNKVLEFKKIQRKTPPKQPCVRIFSYFAKASNQKYLLALMIRCQYGDDKCHSMVIADVDGGERGRLFLMGEKGRSFTHALSVHFLNRHNERMGHHESTVLQKLARYFVYAYLYSSFWYEEKDTRYIRNVCACKHGLALCEIDRKYGFLFFRTFVNKDMLKDSQLEAFNKVITKDYESDCDDLFRTFLKSKEDGMAKLNGIGIYENDKREIAREIYNKFFGIYL